MRILGLFLLTQFVGVVGDFCNIPRIFLSDITQQFYLPSSPTVFVTSSERNVELTELGKRNNLIANHGMQEVILSSSNSYSHGRTKMPLENYIREFVDLNPMTALANESFYLFGDNYDGVFEEMEKLYAVPHCKYCSVAGANSFGIAGKNSGVAFHFHGPGFSEALIGRKRWFLFPPKESKHDEFGISIVAMSKGDESVPGFNPNMTMSEWVDTVYPTVKKAETVVTGYNNPHIHDSNYNGIAGSNSTDSIDRALYECTIVPGEYLYFPSGWMHATLNLDEYNFFVSIFLDEQLMHD